MSNHYERFKMKMKNYSILEEFVFDASGRMSQ